MPNGSPEIRRVIQIIDDRIQSLQTIKKMLLSEFFGEQQQLFPIEDHESTHQIKTVPISELKPKRTRKEAIIEFLRENGPTKSQEIHKRTGIPMGTVATSLNDKTIFERSYNSKWALRAGI